MSAGPSIKESLSLLAEPPQGEGDRNQAYEITLPEPSLAVLWPGREQNFRENLRILFKEPAPPREFLGEPFFRDCWVARPLPERAFGVSVFSHVVFVLLLVWIWPLIPAPAPPSSIPSNDELVYYGPIKDLPRILPAHRVAHPLASARAETVEPAPALPVKGADAYHPRQTIVNNPLRPNHPRQTLIQPLAPPDPPKILPALPNIVALQELAKPQLRIDPAALARLQPKAPAARRDRTAAPDLTNQQLANQEKLAGPLDIAPLDIAESNAPRKPLLPVSPMSAPKAVAARKSATQAAPNVGASAPGGVNLIALSETPGPAMPPAVPAGNLSSHISISPEGKSPGAPGGSPNSGSRESGAGPDGLSITGGGGRAVSAVSGIGSASANARLSPHAAAPGIAAPPAASVMPGISASNARTAPLIAAIKPGMNPEALLGGKRIYTMHVNMPNLTSAMGSWDLTFAELGTTDGTVAANSKAADLSGPEPLRKVDPKYPPQLRAERVEGEVVLYAVIRKNGSVDSIQLVEGIDPTLDRNAMEALAQWQFRPGERAGVPVDLEVIVHVPFRSTVPVR